MRYALRLTKSGAVIAIGAVLLAGCVPVSPVSPSATPTPTVDPLPLAAALPLTCEELASVDELQAFLGGTDPIESLSFTGQPSDLDSVERATRYEQAEIVSCAWTGEQLGSDTEIGLSLEVLPGASADFTTYVGHQGPYPDESELRDSVGDGSIIHCTKDPTWIGQTCSISFLAGEDYWASISLTGLAESVGSVEGVSSFAQTLAARIVAAPLPAAPSHPTPADALGVGLDCDAIHDSDAFKGQNSLSQLPRPDDITDRAGTPLLIAGAHHLGVIGCEWIAAGESTDLEHVVLQITPGAAWNWDTFADAAASQGFSAVDVPDADAAFELQVGNACRLYANVDHSVVGVLVERFDGSVVDSCTLAADLVGILR